MTENEKVSIGLIAGIKDEVLLSPFSAPFGGFHFRHDNIFTSEIDQFILQLTEYAASAKISKTIKLTLPPDIYHHSFNSKMSNALMRNGFSTELPEIINWIDLKQFQREFSCRNARQNYNASLRCKFFIPIVFTIQDEKERAYQIVGRTEKFLAGYPFDV